MAQPQTMLQIQPTISHEVMNWKSPAAEPRGYEFSHEVLNWIISHEVMNWKSPANEGLGVGF